MRRLCPPVALLAVALSLAACGGAPQEAAVPPPTPTPAAQPEKPPKPPAPLSARLTRPTMLRDAPGGAMLTRLDTRTEFDGATVLAVARQEGDWLGVRSPQRPEKLGWIPAEAADLERQPYRLRVDLSERELVVTATQDDEEVLRAPVAVGRPGTVTPTGTYGVTDRLEPKNPYGAYGCCVLALSGRQPNLPQGWGGGDRLAIHATTNVASVGTAASSGCLRADEETMRELTEIIPLGAPVKVVD